MATAKEMQIERDKKVGECLDLLKIIVEHLGISPSSEATTEPEAK